MAIQPNIKTLEVGSQDAPLHIAMFHGYTAAPDEFAELALILHERLGAHVVAPLLPGHGTEERDLLQVHFDDFLDTARNTVQNLANREGKIVILGHSFGGYLALLAAADAKPAALVLTTTPYVLRKRFRRPWMPYLMRTRKFWNKTISVDELESRKHLFFYPHMPGIALSLVKEGIRRIDRVLPSIECPILTIYNADDPISEPESAAAILSKVPAGTPRKSVVFQHDSHGLYYGPHKSDLVHEILTFLEFIAADRAQPLL